MSSESLRECRSCLDSKPLSDFPLTRGKVFFRCRKCTNAASLRWSREHRERSNGNKRAYIERHPERRNESLVKCYEKNKDEYKKRALERKHADPEVTRERYRRQYKNDPTPFIVRNQRRAEREKAVGGRFTEADKKALLEKQNGLCANSECSADLSIVGIHIDHIIPVARGGPHGPENRQLLCPTCNYTKGTLTNKEWCLRRESRAA